MALPTPLPHDFTTIGISTTMVGMMHMQGRESHIPRFPLIYDMICCIMAFLVSRLVTSDYVYIRGLSHPLFI
jgi:hypothetical protein